MFAELFKRTQALMTENSTALLTSVGVAGTVTTAVLTGRAAFKSAEIIHEEELRRRVTPVEPRAGWTEEMYDADQEISRRERISMVWPQFIPPVGVGALTISAIVMANRLSAKEAAALATAYGVSERAFQEYREKVVERIGQNKETSVRDEIVQDRVTKTAPGREVILAGTGEVLCLDLLSGRYFQSTVEEIKKAINEVNFQIIEGMYSSASEFYDLIGLPATEMTDTLGWNLNNKLEVDFTTAMTTDGRPCIAISPTPPVHNYNKLY